MNDKEEIKRLKRKIELLEDENSSLWEMLDELQKSDGQDWIELIDKLREDVIIRSLMTTSKKVEA